MIIASDWGNEYPTFPPLPFERSAKPAAASDLCTLSRHRLCNIQHPVSRPLLPANPLPHARTQRSVYTYNRECSLMTVLSSALRPIEKVLHVFARESANVQAQRLLLLPLARIGVGRAALPLLLHPRSNPKSYPRAVRRIDVGTATRLRLGYVTLSGSL